MLPISKKKAAYSRDARVHAYIKEGHGWTDRRCKGQDRESIGSGGMDDTRQGKRGIFIFFRPWGYIYGSKVDGHFYAFFISFV